MKARCPCGITTPGGCACGAYDSLDRVQAQIDRSTQLEDAALLREWSLILGDKADWYERQRWTVPANKAYVLAIKLRELAIDLEYAATPNPVWCPDPDYAVSG